MTNTTPLQEKVVSDAPVGVPDGQKPGGLEPLEGDLATKVPVDQKLKALDQFKDWSNYLLVTTVAALGWVSVDVVSTWPVLKAFILASLAVSVVFAMLTLALIPLIAHDLTDDNRSIYFTPGRFRLEPVLKGEHSLRLKWVCFPQHVFFLLAIVA